MDCLLVLLGHPRMISKQNQVPRLATPQLYRKQEELSPVGFTIRELVRDPLLLVLTWIFCVININKNNTLKWMTVFFKLKMKRLFRVFSRRLPKTTSIKLHLVVSVDLQNIVDRLHIQFEQKHWGKKVQLITSWCSEWLVQLVEFFLWRSARPSPLHCEFSPCLMQSPPPPFVNYCYMFIWWDCLEIQKLFPFITFYYYPSKQGKGGFVGI